jgi:gliding motility-associated-like protein
MRYALAFIALLIAQHCFAQCQFTVALVNKGSYCAGTDTLFVTSPGNNISQIVWYAGNAIDTTVTAVISAVTPKNGVTVAGGNGRGAGLNQFNLPNGVFVDGSGYLYVSDITNDRVQKFPPGSTGATFGQTVAGGNGIGNGANQLQPNSVCLDANGNLYVADNANARILKFPPGSTGATFGTTVAGGNGQGSAANQFINPVSVFVDLAGNIYVIDAANYRLQKFPPGSTGATNGITLAGANGYGPAPDQFNGAACVHVDSLGNIFVADAANNRIQKFFPGNPNAVTVAGGNGFGAALNQLSTPSSVWVDGAGNIYVADVNNERIQKFPPGSTNATYGKTVAGGNGPGNGADQFSGPNSLCVDREGNIYVSDAGNNRIQKFSQVVDSVYNIDTVLLPSSPGTYTAVVTNSRGCTVTTNAITISPSVRPSVSITGLAIRLSACSAQALDTISFTANPVNGGSNPVYQWQVNGANTGGDSGTLRGVFKVNDKVTCTLTSSASCASPQTVTSSGYNVTNSNLPLVTLASKGGVCLGSDTLVINSNSMLTNITWYNGNTVDTVISNAAAIDSAGIGVTVAGGNGQGIAANQFYTPNSICLDGSGNIYVGDQFNFRVQMFPPNSTSATNGITVAGGNSYGPATNQFEPNSVFVDKKGNLYICDHESNRLLKFPPGSSSITYGYVAAGNNGQGGYPNQFDDPFSVWLDEGGNIFVADAYNGRIEEFPPNSSSATNGITVAGGNGYGQAANQFTGPYSVCVDQQGYIYVADYGNSRIQKFPPGSSSSTDGITIAGGNQQGSAANQLNQPISVFVDNAGNIFVTDVGNNRIQKFPPNSTSATNGITVAGGNGQGSAPNQFNSPGCVWVDGNGYIYVVDEGNNRIQKFSPSHYKGNTIDTILIPSTPGSYTALVTDSAGCTVTTNAIVVNPLVQPSVNVASNPLSVCKGQPFQFTAAVSNAGSSPVYQWLLNGTIIGTNTAAYNTSAIANGDTVACVVFGGPGCYSTDTSNSVIAIVWPQPYVGSANNITISAGQSATLNLPVTGTIASYLWQPPFGLSSDTLASPEASPPHTTAYTLNVTTDNGCTATGGITVSVLSKIYIPAAFTPNGDGHNDIFYVMGGEAGDRIKDFSIYGRWGQKLFEVQNVLPGDPGYGWNGDCNGTQQLPGGYVYIAVITSANGTEKIYKGTVVLVR